MEQTARELLKLLEEYGGDEKKLLDEHKELEFFYALSDIRENLLEWFPFEKEWNLLQIGSGFGALTGLLAGKTGQVTVLCADGEDLEVNRKRWENRGNIRYVNGSLEKYAEQEKGAGFDCVVMADGLGEDPEQAISLAKELVRPEGVLLAAADNPLGLKHWAGVPEEAGAIGLERLRALLPGGECYYPLPDYRTAWEIYSDHRLPAKGDLTGMVISYDYPQFLRTDVGTSWDRICQEESFPQFANSYLMVWRRHG